jgi:hypothetical protein
VSDGIRTRDRRDHNPTDPVLLGVDDAYERALSGSWLLSVALNLDPA